MGELPSTVTNDAIFRIPVPARNSCHLHDMEEAVTRDMASSNWLQLSALCLFHAQSVPKNIKNPSVTRLVQYISNIICIHVIFFCTIVLGSTNISYYFDHHTHFVTPYCNYFYLEIICCDYTFLSMLILCK